MVLRIFCITLIHLAFSRSLPRKQSAAEPNYPFDPTKYIRLRAIKQEREEKKSYAHTVNIRVLIFILRFNRKSPNAFLLTYTIPIVQCTRV